MTAYKEIPVTVIPVTIPLLRVPVSTKQCCPNKCHLCHSVYASYSHLSVRRNTRTIHDIDLTSSSEKAAQIAPKTAPNIALLPEPAACIRTVFPRWSLSSNRSWSCSRKEAQLTRGGKGKIPAVSLAEAWSTARKHELRFSC